MGLKKVRTQASKQLSGGQRIPRTGADDRTVDDRYPLFSFRYADRSHCGSWSWLKVGDHLQLHDFLCEMSRLSWREIRAQMSGGHRKHHSQGIVTLEKAQQRILQLHLDEVIGDELFRFRLEGAVRLWGFLDEAVFHVLWWDAGHQVYVPRRR
ncbi:hypothetical protein [Actinoplanes derwentensis]|uniref:Uncharacterized protein n=1 Tax=Actinoplanes derwentensis TaxID=113562 RepID=A0A1H1R6A0_9ACTN|nr:hypothetical protein [Actinoplanes derwentensis]GID88027.1 hypothetical protein Ade03nite_69510 [Actinoplanes derwentensis]SDS31267.1 hypothetical protein SAMN04489716_0508 [Actinoplanes derwentensis]